MTQDRIYYGGDYNPEQWPVEVWDDDVRLMREAGVNLVSLGIFAWAKLEPRNGEFDFEWLDLIIDKLSHAGIGVDLATATASPPPWLTHEYPEVLPVTADGVVLQVGSRQQYCPSSPVYRELSARLVSALVERYGANPAIVLWHANNEYGCHVSHCYCDVSAAAFREWLRNKYGTVEALNDAWGTAFWSQHYGGFEEIRVPSAAPSFRNPAQLVDFDRFSSDELLNCFRNEVAVIRTRVSKVPITTNFMGFFRDADYWAWASVVDVVSDDCYPDPADPDSPAYAAMTRDLMRSLGGGAPWLLMEQAPGAVNWRRSNAPKREGEMRAYSMQAVARGADGVLFFQWRQSVAGAERFHSGMVPHAGTDSRIWRSIVALGAELPTVATVIGERVIAKVAIVFEWDSWWSIEQPALPTSLSYVEGVFAWYRRLWARNVAVDFVRAGDDLSDYSVVIVPSLFSASPSSLDNLANVVRAGSQLVVTFQTGIVDENSRITEGGYLGSLREVLGVRVEEFAPFAAPDLRGRGASAAPTGAIRGELTGDSDAQIWAEFLHCTDATTEATFAGGQVDGWPAITRRPFESGSGVGWYVATQPGDAALDRLIQRLVDDAAIAADLVDSPDGVEVVLRGGTQFAINHTDEQVELLGRAIPARGVLAHQIV
jgi:beta-galactosidase